MRDKADENQMKVNGDGSIEINPMDAMQKMQAEMEKMLMEAQKTAADIIEQAKVAASQVVVAESVVAQKEPEKPEMVAIQLFKDGDRYKDDLTVALNGKTYTIKRGVTVQVPKGVAEIISSSLNQDIAAAIYREQKEEEYAATLK